MKHNNKKTLRLAGCMLLMGIMTFVLIGKSAQAEMVGLEKKAPASFADLADAVKHSVVNISTTQVVKGSPREE